MALPFERIGPEIRRAIRARGVMIKDVADMIGMTPAHLSNVMAGRNIPSHRTCVLLSEALDWPGLAEMSLQKRTGQCVVCGKPFVSDAHGGQPRRFCGARCLRTAANRTHRQTTMENAAVARHRLALHAAAVTEFCRQCEPDGLCRDSGCALRGVSPLPLISVRLRIA